MEKHTRGTQLLTNAHINTITIIHMYKRHEIWYSIIIMLKGTTTVQETQRLLGCMNSSSISDATRCEQHCAHTLCLGLACLYKSSRI